MAGNCRASASSVSRLEAGSVAGDSKGKRLFSSPGLRKSLQLVGFLVLASVAAGSMWLYVQRVLVPYETADAIAHQRPRGNLSDLYPRWLGARELLLDHRNPYGDDVTAEIQQGYYGRELDSKRPNDPIDQQGFAYPVYVVFVLAPLVAFPFHAVQIAFYWLLLGLTAASVWLWLRALPWRLPVLSIAPSIILTLGSFSAVQGIKLQQLSLLVAALMAGAAAFVAGDNLFSAGALLALATIKPQLAWPLVAWLFLWSVSDWRRRRRFVFGFGAVMVLLLAGAEIVLPGWWRTFIEALRQYHRYTRNESVLDQLLPWAFAGKVAAGVALLASGFLLWRSRVEPAASVRFGRTTALVLALTVLVVPMVAPYNQVLLLPAILALVRDRKIFFSRARGVRFLYLAGVFALAWQWIASAALVGMYLFGSEAWALERWWLPFFATFATPLIVFALTFLLVSWRLVASEVEPGAASAARGRG